MRGKVLTGTIAIVIMGVGCAVLFRAYRDPSRETEPDRRIAHKAADPAAMRSSNLANETPIVSRAEDAPSARGPDDHRAFAAAAGTDEVPFRDQGGNAKAVIEGALSLAQCCEILEGRDPQMCSALKRRLLRDADYDLLDALLEQGVHAETLAFGVLLELSTHQAMVNVLGHLMTRPEFGKQWRVLASRFGDYTEASAVNLLVDLLIEATPAGQARLLALIPHIQREDALFELLLRAGSLDDPLLNNIVMQSVFEMGKASSMALMHDLLIAHDDPQVRALAAAALAGIGTAETTELLAEVGSLDTESGDAALAALESIDSGYAQQSLIAVVADQRYGRKARVAAARALGGREGSDYVRRMTRSLALVVNDPIVSDVLGANLIDLEEQTSVPREGVELANQQDELWF